MKKINIIYWIATGLLAAAMLLSAVTSILNGPDVVKSMAHLGYPPYFGRYLGVAKLLGVIAILVPGFPKIREWAYAGFAFDLISATYSVAAVGDGLKNLAPFPIFFAIFIVSYIYNAKRLKAVA